MRHRASDRRWLGVAVLVGITALVPAGYFGFPYLHRWQMLSALSSHTPAQRQAAAAWAAAHFASDRTVREAVMAKLKSDTAARFFQLQQTLDVAGIWDRRHIPPKVWLRWLTLLARQKDARVRQQAARRAANMISLVNNPSLIALLHRLEHDANAAVRSRALSSIIALWGAPNASSTTYQAMVHAATDDPSPSIASRAWITLALRCPLHGYHANWRAAKPAVISAVLYAAMRTNPDRPAPAITALGDKALPATARAAAAYALHFSRRPAATAALLDVIPAQLSGVTKANAHIVWAAVLAVHLTENANNVATRRLTSLTTSAQRQTLNSWQQAVMLAALSRVGRVRAASTRSPIQRLAILESEHSSPAATITPQTGPVLRLAIARHGRRCTPAMLWPVFAQADSALRDEACMLAVRRLEPGTCRRLIARLLRAHRPAQRQAGALLAGMTGDHHDLLRDVLAAENDWPTAVVMRLGLAMQVGRGGPAAAVLDRNNLPASTVLLTLLMQGNRMAWNHLLGPTGYDDAKLDNLLRRQRWWFVLKPLLGPHAPTYWLWASASLRRFQLQVLRQWYLLHRQRLTHLTTVGYRSRIDLSRSHPHRPLATKGQ